MTNAHTHVRTTRLLRSLAIGTLAAAGLGIGAQAQVPVQNGYTYVDSAGRTVLVDRTVVAGPGGYSGQVSASNGRGFSGTRTFSGTRLAPGQYGYASGFVGNGGARTQSSSVVTCDSFGQCVRNGQYIGPRGGIYATDAQTRFGPGGAFDARSRTVDPRGNVYQRDVRSGRTAFGRAGSSVRTGPYGTSSRDFERVRRPGGYVETSTYTGPRGRMFDRRADVDCRGGSCARTVTRVGPDGRAVGYSGNSRRVAPGVWEGSRTFTDRRGRERTRDWRWERRR